MFALDPMWTLKRTCLLIVFGAVLSPTAHAGSVNGQFVLDGKPFKPAEVAAFRVRDPADQSKLLTYVVLTAKPVNADKIKNSPDPVHSLRYGPEALGDHLGIWIHADNTIEVAAHVDGDAFTEEAYPEGSPGVPGLLTGTCKVNTATHVTCNVKTKKPSKTRDDKTCTLNLTFDTDVLTSPPVKP
jgi:hypothetical protein